MNAALLIAALIGPAPETNRTVDILINNARHGQIEASWHQINPVLDKFKYEITLRCKVRILDYLEDGPYEQPGVPMYRIGRRDWKPLPGSMCPCGCWIIPLHHAVMMHTYELSFPKDHWWQQDGEYGYWKKPDPPEVGQLGFIFEGIKDDYDYYYED